MHVTPRFDERVILKTTAKDGAELAVDFPLAEATPDMIIAARQSLTYALAWANGEKTETEKLMDFTRSVLSGFGAREKGI